MRRFERARVSYLVLLGALLLTGIATYAAARLFQTRDHLQFSNGIQQTEEAIQRRLDIYVDMLVLGSALYGTSQTITPDEFRDYVQSLRLSERYPGIQGIGFSLRLAAAQVEEVVRQMRSGGMTNFQVWPQSPRSEFHTITYLEPMDARNLRAMGYDMFTEPVRRAAMEQARDTGLPVASGKVVLVQELGTAVQAGFLIYVPVYRGRTTPKTVAERQEKLIGFVYSPFRTGDLLRGIFGTDKHLPVEFAVFDGDAPVLGNLLYRSPGYSASSWKSRFFRHSSFTVASRRWHMEFASGANLESTSGLVAVPFIGLGGLAVSLLLFKLTAAQSQAYRAIISQRRKAEILQKRQNAQIALRAETSAAFTGADEEGTQALQRCMEALVRRLPAIFAGAWIRDEETSEPTLQASAGFPGGPSEIQAQLADTMRQINRVAQTGQPFVTNDPLTDPELSAAVWTQTFGVRAWLVCPLAVEGRVLGVISLFSEEFVTGDKVAFVHGIADLIAYGLHRKRIQQALHQSEERLRLAVESAELGTWEFDLNTLNVHWSSRTRELLGGSPSSTVAYDDFIARLHPEDRGPVQSRIAQALHRDGDGHYEVDFRARWADGTIRWISTKGRVFFEGKGDARRPVRFTGTALDISARKKAEESSWFLAEAGRILSESLDYEKSLNSLAELAVPRMADGCFVDLVDSSGAVRALATVCLTLEKLALAKALRTPGPGTAWILPAVSEVLRSGEATFQNALSEDKLGQDALEATTLHGLRQLDLRSLLVVPLKTHHRIFGTIAFVSGESGRAFSKDDLVWAEGVAGRAGLAVDRAMLFRAAQQEISDRKKAEEEVSHLNQDLERRVARRTAALQESHEQMEAFTYTVAHDLRAPLRAMQGFSQALIEDFSAQLGDQGRDYAARVISAAQRMDALIQDLLAYSRLTRAAFAFERVDLDVAVSRALSTLGSEIKRTDAQLHVHRPFPHVKAHLTTLEQVLGNLVGNGLKFVEPGTRPEIRLWAERKDTHVRVFCQDNGIGIDPEHHERIFRVFERLHSNEFFPGTGIGLAIVRKGVERMDGRVGLESEPGKGSTFWVELPAADA